MMDYPLVSVIIPSYNHAPYIVQRIDSVLAQTYPNFEVIILDDCSPDNSRELIMKYEGKPHISKIILNETNTGNTFRQWEKGIQLAKGSLIWIAESDDYAAPSFLEKVVSKMTSTPDCVIGFSHSTIVDKEGKELPWSLDKPKLYSHQGIYDGTAFARARMIRSNNLYNASMIVFRRECFGQVDPLYKSLRYAGDWAFWLCICTMGTIVEVPECLNAFRQHPKKVTFSAQKEGEKLEEVYRIFSLAMRLLNLTPRQQQVCRAIYTDILKKDKSIGKERRQQLKTRYPILFAGNAYDSFIRRLDNLLGHRLSGIR